MTDHAKPAAILGRRELDAAPFGPERCEALYAAILVDDVVDEATRLPDAVRLDYEVDELVACFRLARELWYSGFSRDALLALVDKLVRDRDLAAEDRAAYKEVRAKFKAFRYAFALFASDHRYPRLLNRVTVTMGHLQDAYRHDRRLAVLGHALRLRTLLTALPLRQVYREADRLAVTTPRSFRALIEQDVRVMRRLVEHDTVTGHRFHATRKVVGRQVAFWDALRTIAPDPDRYNMSRSMSAINGLMGRLHDDLVEQRGADRKSYGAHFRVPDEIRRRVIELIPAYELPG